MDIDNNFSSTSEIDIDDTRSISPIYPNPVQPSFYINSEIFKVILSNVESSTLSYDEYISNKSFINKILENLPKPKAFTFNVQGTKFSTKNSSLHIRRVSRVRPIINNISNRLNTRLQNFIASQNLDRNNLARALNNYINNPVRIYEHQVATLADWLLQHYFNPNMWSKTPEQMQSSKKIPDFVISGLYHGELHPKVLVELKKHKGASFSKILSQVEKSGLTALGNNGEYAGDETKFNGPSMFHVAIRGLNIAFMERYNYSSLLDEEDVPNYEGIIPLTQKVNPTLGTENTELSSLFAEMELKSEKSTNFAFPYPNEFDENLVKNSKFYVFHIEKDAELVHKLLCYISSNLPRIQVKDS